LRWIYNKKDISHTGNPVTEETKRWCLGWSLPQFDLFCCFSAWFLAFYFYQPRGIWSSIESTCYWEREGSITKKGTSLKRTGSSCQKV
jgi:hypothetical protein